MTEYKPAELSAPRYSSVPQYPPSYDSGEYSQYFTHYSAPVLRSKRTLSLEAYDLLHDQVCQSQVIEYAYSDGSVEYTCTHIQQPNGQWVYINGKLDSLSDLCYRMRNSRNPEPRHHQLLHAIAKLRHLLLAGQWHNVRLVSNIFTRSTRPLVFSPPAVVVERGFKFKCHRFV